MSSSERRDGAAAGPAWESPWEGMRSDAQGCRAGQAMNPGHPSHMPGAGFRQHTDGRAAGLTQHPCCGFQHTEGPGCAALQK